MTSQPRDLTRTDQADELLRVLREARKMGYGRVEVEVTRGGTVRAVAETGEGAVVRQPLKPR